MDDAEVQELQDKITQLKEELREYGTTTEDTKCAALCETSAEVMQGLETAFSHYQNKSEQAWQ